MQSNTAQTIVESNCFGALSSMQYIHINLSMSIPCTTGKMDCQLTCMLEHLKMLLLTHPVELTTVQEAVPQLLSSADV